MSIDRLIYTSNSGLKQVMDRMSTASSNLANVSTNGFRAQIGSLRSLQVEGDGMQTRTLAVDANAGVDFTPGVIHETGRDLDVAIEGRGWIVVQGRDGREAYTRAGSLTMDLAGMLQLQNGLKVMGDGGPITIPPDHSVLIGKDGTVSASQSGISSNSVQVLGRIRLVDPPDAQLVRGDDGLFRLAAGAEAAPSANVTLVSKAVEASNVNSIEEMVTMVSLARQFEMHAKMLQNVESIGGKADQLLTFT